MTGLTQRLLIVAEQFTFLTNTKTGPFVMKTANGKHEKWCETHDHVVFLLFMFAINVTLNLSISILSVVISRPL